MGVVARDRYDPAGTVSPVAATTTQHRASETETTSNRNTFELAMNRAGSGRGKVESRCQHLSVGSAVSSL